MTEPSLRSYKTSETMLERALSTIPLGSQTFSKSYTQYPRGAAPFFISRAQGSKATDIDGNVYIDFVNSLAAVTLGHADPDVNDAVEKQLRDGVVFTLSHPIEIEVAEMICDMVPCAQSVRFGKNGSDATAGAIRVARAFTGRDRVAMCGYHGWQDWSIGTTARNKGVPKATQDLTSTFIYNDIVSLEAVLEAHPGEFAAVILEPMNVAYPLPGFLESVVALARKHGAVSVFDETITGFRFANGGAQELFGVTPDLATFGKGLANGFPVSALAGRAEIMAECSEIFFSFTMGGETLSLAAALATMKKLRKENVIAKMTARGDALSKRVQALIDRHHCGHFLSTTGHPTWSFLHIRDTPAATMWEIKTLWLQEILSYGILSVGTHNLSYAHDEQDIDTLIGVYDKVFPVLRDAIDDGRITQLLRCEPLQPLFKVR